MKRVLYLIVGMLLAAACTTGPGLTASVISTLNTVGTGEQRVLIELRDAQGEPLASESVPNVTLRNENGSPLGVYPGELVWLVPDEVPVYAFVMQIPEAETYQVTVDAGELGETPPAGFVAVEDPIQVEVGELAPDLGGEPFPGPSLVVFASPNWCPARSCQPMIDQTEAVAESNPDLSWAQVEVFADPQAESEEELELAPVVDDWGLPSQPWLYVIDDAGLVSSRFEGALSDRELEEAVAAITS